MADIPDSVDDELNDILGRGGAGGDGGGDAGVNPDIRNLERAWTCEKAAPELLPYEGLLVDSLQGMLEIQVAALADLARDEAAPGAPRRHPTVVGAYALDVARVRFLLSAYLRTRLAKVRARGREVARTWWLLPRMWRRRVLRAGAAAAP